MGYRFESTGQLALVALAFLVNQSHAIRIHRRDESLLDPVVFNATQRTAQRKAVTVEVPATPDGHLVTDPLPLTKEGQALDVKHWAGLLPVHEDKQNFFFYWLFEPEVVKDDTPLLIWLNGGPACSSMDGLFLENGPIRWTIVDGKYMLEQNPSSWHKSNAYTLYIDQPVGTGLSFTTNKSYPRNDKEVNTHFYNFLISFFNLHGDKFVKGSATTSVFFSGESHAGHYIPSMMNYILKKNNQGADLTISLSGAAIGNGWMDPIYQYAAAEAAYGHGLLGREQVNAFAVKEKSCQDMLRRGNYRASVCFSLLDDIVDQSYGSSANYHVSQYDVRVSEKKGAPRTFPEGHKVVETYLGGHSLPSWEKGTMDKSVKASVLEAIHASASAEAGQVFLECTDPPYQALAHQDGKGVVDDIVAVLEDATKPRLLFFNGIEDLICNHVGNEKALENLPWKGKDSWIQSKRFAWITSSSGTGVAGFVKQYQNLLYLKVLNAGHMVPMDQPEIALEMITTLISGGSFKNSAQDISASDVQASDPCPICHDCPVPSNECLSCPSAEDADCSAEIQKAQAESSGNGSGAQSINVVWLIPILALLALLYVTIMWRIRSEGNNVGATNNVELQESRYTDDPEDEDT